MKTSKVRILVMLAVCLAPALVVGQLRFNVYSGGYFNITDYAGFTTSEGTHQFHIQYNGTYIQEEQWAVKARINGPIKPMSGENVSGMPFPADKISFRFTHDDGNNPTLAAIGASTAFIPFSATGETVLIPQSNAPISHASQYAGNMQFHLYFAINIAGGAYLNQFKNKAQYQMIVYAVPITFTLYRKDGSILGYQDVLYRIQVNQTLSGTSSAEPEYGIEVLGEARDGKLEFGTIANYVEGVKAVYPDGLKINANTGYSITVRAVANDMMSTSGNQATIPVSVVNVQLQPGSTPATGGAYPEVSLSNGYQPLFNTLVGRDVPQYFTLIYRTQGNDERLMNARSGTYTTTILYQLVPQ